MNSKYPIHIPVPRVANLNKQDSLYSLLFANNRPFGDMWTELHQNDLTQDEVKGIPLVIPSPKLKPVLLYDHSFSNYRQFQTRTPNRPKMTLNIARSKVLHNIMCCTLGEGGGATHMRYF